MKSITFAIWKLRNWLLGPRFVLTKPGQDPTRNKDDWKPSKPHWGRIAVVVGGALAIMALSGWGGQQAYAVAMATKTPTITPTIAEPTSTLTPSPTATVEPTYTPTPSPTATEGLVVIQTASAEQWATPTRTQAAPYPMVQTQIVTVVVPQVVYRNNTVVQTQVVVVTQWATVIASAVPLPTHTPYPTYTPPPTQTAWVVTATPQAPVLPVALYLPLVVR